MGRFEAFLLFGEGDRQAPGVEDDDLLFGV